MEAPFYERIDGAAVEPIAVGYALAAVGEYRAHAEAGGGAACGFFYLAVLEREAVGAALAVEHVRAARAAAQRGVQCVRGERLYLFV